MAPNTFYRSKFLIIAIFLLLLLSTFNCSPTDKAANSKTGFKELLELGKKSFYEGDYKSSIDYLEKAVLIKTDNQESHYFLGYAYERFASKDGAYMLETTLDIIKKSSKHFKRVIDLSPEYKGEYVVLDPYSKLTSIWGSLAMAYIGKGEVDSAKWAFRQGRSAGGFYLPLMEYNKDIMATCNKDAILFTNGDNDTYPMWYAQLIDNYRTDITVINVSLLNTAWYTKQIKNAYPFGINNISLALSDAQIDSSRPKLYTEKKMQLDVPDDSLLTEKYIEWTMKPTIDNKAIRNQDMFILEILKDNKWQRPIYFSSTVARINLIGLDDYLRLDGITLRLVPYSGQEISKEILEQNLFEVYKYEHINDQINQYIKGMIGLYGNYRVSMYRLAKEYLDSDDKAKAKEIIEFMDRKIPEESVPYLSKHLLDLISELKSQL